MRKFFSLLLVLLIAASLAGQAKLAGTGKVGGTAKTAVQAGGGGSDFATDTFTETSDTTVASHTPELGGAITKHSDASYTSTLTIDGALDQAWPSGTTAYWYAATPPSADYYVQLTIKTVTVENASIGPCGHIDTAANNMVCIRLNNGTSWDLRQIVSGTGSTLSTSTNNLPTAGQNRVVRVTFSSGGTVATMSVDGATEGTPQTITVTSTGKAGYRASGGVSVNTGFHIDLFSAR